MTKFNTRKTIFNQMYFNGCEVVQGYHLDTAYLDSIFQLMNRALSEHPRIVVLRFDLHLPRRIDCPDYPYEFESNVITRFLESFKAQLNAHLAKKERSGTRVHRCSVRFAWTKETNNANQPHYHVALILNKDTYFGFGEYRRLKDNLAGKVYKAWASALGYQDAEDVMNLVHIPQDTPYYHIDANSMDFSLQFSEAFRRLSYFAKCEAKRYGDRSKNFMCSRN